MKTILIATDGSAAAETAVAAGLDVARRSGARVLFLGVRRPLPPVCGDEALARLRPALRAAVEKADALGIDADYDLVEGDPAEQIVCFARMRDVDLIVLGCRGVSAVASALLGSVSKRVVREADRHVLVVKEPAARAAS